MPKVIGGMSRGSRNSSISACLPRKSRRASAYAAGTSRIAENSTTRNTAWNVTVSTDPSWNSLQDELYHRVVSPAGSQVPSQRVAKELVTTLAIIASRLRTKKPTKTQDRKSKRLHSSHH